jgi:hypothetical protein
MSKAKAQRHAEHDLARVFQLWALFRLKNGHAPTQR